MTTIINNIEEKIIFGGLKFKELIMFDDVEYSMNFYFGFMILNNHNGRYNELIRLFLTDSRVEPKCNDFINACLSRNIWNVKTLINDSRIDPSDMDNYAMKSLCLNAYGDSLFFVPKADDSDRKTEEIIHLLLNDPRVDPNSCTINDTTHKYLKYHKKWKYFEINKSKDIFIISDNITELVYSYVYY